MSLLAPTEPESLRADSVRAVIRLILLSFGPLGGLNAVCL